MLASLQTFLGFSERAEKHRATAARYGNTRRAVEELIAAGQIEDGDKRIADLRKEIDNLAVDAPGVSERVTRRAREKMQDWHDDESADNERRLPGVDEADSSKNV